MFLAPKGLNTNKELSNDTHDVLEKEKNDKLHNRNCQLCVYVLYLSNDLMKY